MGEPPVLVDPRRWGALIGVVGGLVFIFSYAPPLGAAMSISAEIAGIGLALTVLFGHYIRPTTLGSFREPSRTALLLYVCCVAGELAAIAAGQLSARASDHQRMKCACPTGPPDRVP